MRSEGQNTKRRGRNNWIGEPGRESMDRPQNTHKRPVKRVGGEPHIGVVHPRTDETTGRDPDRVRPSETLSQPMAPHIAVRRACHPNRDIKKHRFAASAYGTISSSAFRSSVSAAKNSPRLIA